jgi:hypothetical protein
LKKKELKGEGKVWHCPDVRSIAVPVSAEKPQLPQYWSLK